MKEINIQKNRIKSSILEKSERKQQNKKLNKANSPLLKSGVKKAKN